MNLSLASWEAAKREAEAREKAEAARLAAREAVLLEHEQQRAAAAAALASTAAPDDGELSKQHEGQEPPGEESAKLLYHPCRTGVFAPAGGYLLMSRSAT